MQKLQMNLENCYGIKKLNETIDYSRIMLLLFMHQMVL